MPFQFVDDNIQALVREHVELAKALEQYYDEQNIMIQKLAKITENEVDKKPSQAYQAFVMQFAQSLVQQQNRVLSLLLTTALARVLERKQESGIVAVKPRDQDVPQDIRDMIRREEHFKLDHGR